MALHRTLGNVNAFLDTIFDELNKRSIDVSHYFLDHICYRTETQDEYQLKKMELDTIGQQLIESVVGGRMIATYELSTPIIYKGRSIPLVELPSPKAGSTYQSGLEHAEFVIDEPFETFMSKYPGLVFKTTGIMKGNNPELGLSLGKYAVKFHHQPLSHVIKEEIASLK